MASLAAGSKKIVPLLVPLHLLEIGEHATFETDILKYYGISTLMPPGTEGDFESIRVYLDGLDEIGSDETRRRVLDLVRARNTAKIPIQVIITSRDYVVGQWLSGIRRLEILPFSEPQMQELVENWLSKDQKLITLFFAQLRESHSLQEMMYTPLLATLIIQVFRQTLKLPESKTRLYEIFVDLLNGGWDLVKGVHRKNRFASDAKLLALREIAWYLHHRRKRELLEEKAREVVCQRMDTSEWTTFANELCRDSLLSRSGAFLTFSHFSVQEFLAAKRLIGSVDLVDREEAARSFLESADEWWREPLMFFLDLTGSPTDALVWLSDLTKAAVKLNHKNAPDRLAVLVGHMKERYPFANYADRPSIV
jgi:predicted NACHT family NTPase